jgi:hypothetical protein
VVLFITSIMTDSGNTTEPTTDNSAEQIRAALHQGKKIEAIKIYREKSGAGLKEAKEAIEQLEADLRASEPEKFVSKKSGGCSPAIVALALIIPLAALCVWKASQI